MKERPILFSGSMVRALLHDENPKTQTRRVVKPQPPAKFCEGDVAAITNGSHWTISKMPGHKAWHPDPHPGIVCPYGQPGDRLWVRESYRLRRESLNGAPMDGVAPNMFCDSTRWFEADGAAPELFGKLRPSIHMPRWASRITLEVAHVRVERLQDISYEDALAEGVSDFAATFADEEKNAIGETPEQTARRLEWPQRQYRSLWDGLNAARGYGWDTNPWVWVIEFARAAP